LLKPGDVDWERLFGVEGVRWFHTGGIFAALSESTSAMVEEVMRTAKRHGTVVSYDLNYRESLWRGMGGKERAREVNRAFAKYIDVMFGNEEDFTAALGFEVERVGEDFSSLDTSSFRKMIDIVAAAHPSLATIAATLRVARTASRNDWGAVCWSEGRFYEAPTRRDLEIYDRVGGGDSFASGLIYGFLTNRDPQWAVECGAAHGALAMTTPGDTSMATLSEVEKAMKGLGTRIER
jgi:2-dehydro-3-deoxygluconokinase